MANEIKIVKFDEESTRLIKGLTSELARSNRIHQDLIGDLLASFRLEQVSLLEGGEFEDAEEDGKPPELKSV